MSELIYSNATDLLEKTFSELKSPPSGVNILGWNKFNEYLGGLRPNELTLLCAPTGCLAGDTKIRLHRNGKGYELTIAEIYRQWSGFAPMNQWDLSSPTFVRSFDGVSVKLHRVKDVVLSGVKETARLRTSQGHSIRLTLCHRMLTERGWVAALDLKSSDRIAHDCMLPRKTNRVRSKVRDTYFGRIKFHPFATKCNDERRIVIHRAAYEAKINNLDLDEYLEIVRSNEAKAITLSFVNPRSHHVHHINHDHYDNRPENLELLPVDEHHSHHGNNLNFNAGQIRWVKFAGLDKLGVEPVYDIECEEPHHNFVANGLVVHNSGKTQFLANISAQLLMSGVPQFIAPVETGDVDYLTRVISVIAACDLNNGSAVTERKIAIMREQIKPILDANRLLISAHDNRVAVEDMATMLKYQFQQYGVRVAILDNLNFFLKVSRSSDTILEMDNAIHEFVMLSKKLPIHTILVMHPKKTDGGRVTSEFDAKGSSTAVQEASNFFALNRPTNDDIENGKAAITDRELIFYKIRKRGMNVRKPIWFNFINGCVYEERKEKPDAVFRSFANRS